VGGACGLATSAQVLNVWDHALRVRVLQGGWASRNVAGGTSSCSCRRDGGVVGDGSVQRRGWLELEGVLASDGVAIIGCGGVVGTAGGVRLGVAVAGWVVWIWVKGRVANRGGWMGELMREWG
jgi:hypothetical protein